jgi:hypothetical protein
VSFQATLNDHPASYDIRCMWSNVIIGVFTLAGLTVGVLLEPLKELFGARARTRRQRAELAALIVSSASDTRHLAVELNAYYRHRLAGHRVDHEQQSRCITDYNEARNDLRKSVGLLRLHGPDVLADHANTLWQVDSALFRLLQEPDDGDHELTRQPKRVQQASENVDSVVQSFAGLARKHTA